MSKEGIARTTIVLVLIVVVLAAGLIYYATLPPPPTPTPTPPTVTVTPTPPTPTTPPTPPTPTPPTVTITPTPPPGPATITGKVTDAKTGLPIEGAKVSLDGYTAATGSDGTYKFSVKVGTYTVTVSVEGYDTKTTSVSVTEEKTYSVNVPLSKTPPPTPDFVKANALVYEGPAAFEWMDPHVSYYQYDYWILWHSVEMLLWYDGSKTTEIIPWLAESYKELSTTQYEFKLRKGIKFQDGTPFNAMAVWFSMNRLLIMDGTSGTGVHGSQAAWIIQQMLDTSLSATFSGDQPYDAAWVRAVLAQNFVEIVDDYTVRINILNPTTQFPFLMAGPWAAIVSPTSVIAKDYEYHGWGTWDGNYTAYFEHMAGVGDTYFNLPTNGWKMGTGPYYVESVDATTYRIVLKANPTYWGGPTNTEHPIGKPKITTIEMLYQPSLATRLLDLQAGKVTAIGVSPLDIYQVVDRDTWLNEGKLESIIPYVNVYGVFPQFVTTWFNFCTNVTTPTGELRKFQPIADWRFRMAIASAVNMTDMNIYVNNRLGIVAENLIPPGTAPEGAYIPDVKRPWTYNLTRAEELLVDAWEHPLTEFTYYNGTPIPPGIVDNSFSEDNPQTIEMYVPAGATNYERVLTTIAENLNRISIRRHLGLTFMVVPVPGGQQYTLASMHRIYMYWGGWVADYNHVNNWLGPMLLSTGTYFSWNLWNVTSLDTLFHEAVEADAAGDVTRLLEINREMNRICDDMALYLWLWHPALYFVRSAWLKGWYVNTVHGVDIWSAMYYETP